MVRYFARRHKNQPEVRILHTTGLPGSLGKIEPSVDARVSLDGRENLHAYQMKGRIWLVLSVFVLIFFGMAVRLADVSLMGSQAQRFARFSPANPLPLERALITDRNDRRLAMNQEVVGAAVNMRDVWNADDTAEKLVTVFPDIDVQFLKRRLATKKYVPLREELGQEEKQALLELGLPGVEFTQSTKRVYPQGALGSHAIGYVIPGRGGAAGLEYVIDVQGADGVLKSALDIRAQQILEEEMFSTLTEFSALSAWGVIMDITTGEVIALANLPDYNPNEPNASPADHWRNRAMHDVYELGSAFKVISAAVALETGVTDMDEQYDVRQPLTIRNKTISDYKPKGGFMTISQIVQYSSNIGMAQVALKTGAKRQKAYLAHLGLTTPLTTELPEFRSPMLPLQWGDVELATVSYGHGIAVTPLQLTAAVAAVLNGGLYVKPTFLKSEKSIELKRVFSEETSATMRLILRRVVTDGTARAAEAAGYYAIGKTATADKPSPFGGYKKDERLSSFIGAFPGYDPKYVILVSFDEPQPTPESYGYATAGIVAAPAFRRIVSRLAPALGIKPVNDDLAFAKFMSTFKATEEIQLAMKKEDVSTSRTAERPDEMAKLLSELGP